MYNYDDLVQQDEPNLEIQNLFEVTRLVREDDHQIPKGAFARMITFKERDQHTYSI